MVQEIKIGDFTFQSTTDSKTIVVTDDKFAELVMLDRLANKIELLRFKVG